MRNRLGHQLYAALCGYFWLPCPLCSQEFGGHEWRDIDGKSSVITETVGKDGLRETGFGICPDCTEAGRGDSFTDPVNPIFRTEENVGE